MDDQSAAATLIRPLLESDLDEADRIFRLAFGTFIGIPDPMQFGGDTDFVRTRWRRDPTASFAADYEGKLAGSVLVTLWGSFGFFGPLTTRPDLWDKGIGKRLLEPVMELFASRGATHTGLYTFSHSAKHVALYQKFGFWPTYLTAIVTKPLDASHGAPVFDAMSKASVANRVGLVDGCREVASAIHDGLDLTHEIEATLGQGLGEVVAITDDAGVCGFAVCHCGPGTEAGSGNCFVKFGAVRPGPNADSRFDRLIDSCAAWGLGAGATRLGAGINTGRHRAYRRLIERGFRTQMQGVAMQRPNELAYNRPDVYAVDDWR